MNKKPTYRDLEQRIKRLEEEAEKGKRMEEILRCTEARYHSFIATSHEWLWEIDLSVRYTFSSPVVQHILGYDPDEIVGQRVLDLIHEEDLPMIKQTLARSIEQKAGWTNLVIRWKHRDGSYRFLESNAVPIIDGTGIVEGFQGSDRDITDRKRNEEALKKSEDLLHLITDNMSDMIRVMDLQGNNLYVSASHFKGLGYSVEERVGKSAFDIVHPEDIEMIMNKFTEGLSNYQRVRVEYRVRHKNGHYIWLDTVADIIRDDQGNPRAVINSSRDISDRKQMDEKLRESEEKYRRITENMSDVVTEVDARASSNTPVLPTGGSLGTIRKTSLMGLYLTAFIPKTGIG